MRWITSSACALRIASDSSSVMNGTMMFAPCIRNTNRPLSAVNYSSAGTILQSHHPCCPCRRLTSSGSSKTVAVLGFGVSQHVLCFSLSPLGELRPENAFILASISQIISQTFKRLNGISASNGWLRGSWGDSFFWCF